MDRAMWEVREQLAATDALIEFLDQHDEYVPEDLRASREAFAAGNLKEGCRLSFRVRPFGNGSLTDGSVRQKFAHESDNFRQVALEAVVRNWCFWITVADDKSTSWLGLVRAIGSLFQ